LVIKALDLDLTETPESCYLEDWPSESVSGVATKDRKSTKCF